MELAALRTRTENLSRDERAQMACDLAKKMEKIGEYETGALALEEFWPNQNEAPIVDDLAIATRARVLLRVGNLMGFLGTANEIPGNQERAKDLISQSMELFESEGNDAAVAESRGDLALCYWREGGYDEARIHLASVESIRPRGFRFESCSFDSGGHHRGTHAQTAECFEFLSDGRTAGRKKPGRDSQGRLSW